MIGTSQNIFKVFYTSPYADHELIIVLYLLLNIRNEEKLYLLLHQ